MCEIALALVVAYVIPGRPFRLEVVDRNRELFARRPFLKSLGQREPVLTVEESAIDRRVQDSGGAVRPSASQAVLSPDSVSISAMERLSLGRS